MFSIGIGYCNGFSSIGKSRENEVSQNWEKQKTARNGFFRINNFVFNSQQSKNLAKMKQVKIEVEDRQDLK